MIQRIQSVYMFMAAVLMAINFFVPLASFQNGAKEVVSTLYGLGFCNIDAAAACDVVSRPWGMIVFALASVVLTLWALFSYKSRMKQLRLLRWTKMSMAVYALAYVAYSCSFALKAELQYVSSWGFVLPILALVFIFLAARGVKKDEELVRAADRIR